MRATNSLCDKQSMSSTSKAQGLLALCLVLGSGVVSAEDTPPASGGSDALAEVVVTAEKRESSIEKVPISLSAVNQEQLDAQGIKSISDLARTVPGLNALAGVGLDTNISIRGILTNVGAPTTGVYINETPIASRYICFYCGFTSYPQLFDLERVEVLRGPQGTLFGAGSEGGTIRFITPAPSLHSYSGYLRAEVAATEHGALSHETGAAVGGPIIANTLGFRASLWTRTDGGYIDLVDRSTGVITNENSNSQKSYVGRLALTWKAANNLTVAPEFFWQKIDVADRATEWLDAGPLRSFNPLRAPSRDTQRLASLNVTYALASVTLKSITSYFNREQDRVDDYTYSDLAYYGGVATFPPELQNYRSRNYQTTKQDSWTQEFRVTSEGDGPLAVTAGLYFSSGSTSFQQAEIPSDFEGLTQFAYGDTVADVYGEGLVNGANYLEWQTQRDKEAALFGQIDYHITRQLKLSAGTRVASERFSFTDRHDGPEAGGPFSTAERSATSHPVTPRASLSYDQGEAMYYATVAKGFRQGGGNASLAGVSLCASDIQQIYGANAKDVPGTYAPDSVLSYELGAKSRLADGHATVSGSVYWVDWRNIQTNVGLPACGYNFTSNVGSAVSRGFDLQAAVRPLDGLTLSATVAYDDTYNARSLIVNGVYLIHKGTPLAIPDWSGTAGIGYERLLGADLQGYGRVDYQYQSAYTRGYIPGDLAFDAPINDVGASKYASVRLGVRYLGADISLFANNVFNAHPNLGLTQDLLGFGNLRQETLRPRTVGITGTYRF